MAQNVQHMKKILMLAAILLASVGSAMAQKGEQSAKVHLNFGSTAGNVGLGAEYRYGLTDNIRFAPSLTYYFGGDGMFDVSANFHYVFHVAPKIDVYPLAGLGFDLCRFQSFEAEGSIFDPGIKSTKETNASFKFDFGGGVEYAVTDKISVGLELRYEIITGGFSQFVAGIGAAYKF